MPGSPARSGLQRPGVTGGPDPFLQLSLSPCTQHRGTRAPMTPPGLASCRGPMVDSRPAVSGPHPLGGGLAQASGADAGGRGGPRSWASSSPVLLARLGEAGLAAGPHTRLASGHLGTLLSLEPVSPQSWPRVRCPGRLGSPVPRGACGRSALVLRRPWRASAAWVGRGPGLAPLCSAPQAPLCRNPQKPPLRGCRASRPPAAPLVLGSALGPVHIACCTHVHTRVAHLTRTSPTRSHPPPCRGRGLPFGAPACLRSQARGKRVVGRLPRPPCVSSSVAGGPGRPSLRPHEHSHHPGGPRTASPAQTPLRGQASLGVPGAPQACAPAGWLRVPGEASGGRWWLKCPKSSRCPPPGCSAGLSLCSQGPWASPAHSPGFSRS